SVAGLPNGRQAPERIVREPCFLSAVVDDAQQVAKARLHFRALHEVDSRVEDDALAPEARWMLRVPFENAPTAARVAGLDGAPLRVVSRRQVEHEVVDSRTAPDFLACEVTAFELTQGEALERLAIVVPA